MNEWMDGENSICSFKNKLVAKVLQWSFQRTRTPKRELQTMDPKSGGSSLQVSGQDLTVGPDFLPLLHHWQAMEPWFSLWAGNNIWIRGKHGLLGKHFQIHKLLDTHYHNYHPNRPERHRGLGSLPWLPSLTLLTLPPELCLSSLCWFLWGLFLPRSMPMMTMAWFLGTGAVATLLAGILGTGMAAWKSSRSGKDLASGQSVKPVLGLCWSHSTWVFWIWGVPLLDGWAAVGCSQVLSPLHLESSDCPWLLVFRCLGIPSRWSPTSTQLMTQTETSAWMSVRPLRTARGKRQW